MTPPAARQPGAGAEDERYHATICPRCSLEMRLDSPTIDGIERAAFPRLTKQVGETL